MNKNSAHIKNWPLSKWLLFAIFSLQSVLLSGWTAQDAFAVDSATYTEWIIDQGFHSHNPTISLWENNQLNRNNSSFALFKVFPISLSLNVIIAVKLNHAETVLYQFPSPIYYLQRSIYFYSLESMA